MARKLRIHFPSAVYHVILRGNAGDPIFFSDQDRYRLYLIFQYAVERFDCRIHAFCLMRNHIHLVVQTGDIPLSRIMQNVSLRFTKWINYSQSRTGHLFQGRYKALLIDADAYLLELVRYIHLNPVRAGIVAAADEYPWSGHGACLGKEILPWFTTDYVLSMFSANAEQARKAYDSFAQDGVGEGKRNEFQRGTCEGRILGSDSFTDEILSMADQKSEQEYSLSEVIATVCVHFHISEEMLTAAGKARPMTEARAVAAAIVQIAPQLRLTDLAKLLGRDISALGKAAQRIAGDVNSRRLVSELVDAMQTDGSECPKL
jgi:REP element-mobilizing transposase RayT